LTYYRADVQDLITFVQTGATRFDYRNVNQARIQGTEVGVNSMLTDTLILRSSFDWNDAVDARTGARLTQRARYTFRFGLDWKATESTNVNVFWRALFDYYGGSLQNPNANAINSNYNRLDIRVDQKIVPGVAMYAGVDGILGSPVPYTMAPIEPPGPFIYAGVSLRF
jgi:outer membrane receptor for ferrienterochelin and colicins